MVVRRAKRSEIWDSETKHWAKARTYGTQVKFDSPVGSELTPTDDKRRANFDYSEADEWRFEPFTRTLLKGEKNLKLKK